MLQWPKSYVFISQKQKQNKKTRKKERGIIETNYCKSKSLRKQIVFGFLADNKTIYKLENFSP
jgi:hypothetical protein